MKVGEYVRTIEGYIFKIIEIDKDRFYVSEDSWVSKELIIRNGLLNEVIEYGDIVKYKIDDEEFISKVWGEKDNYFVQHFDVTIDLKDLNIVSVTTHERFSQIEYRIEE